MYLNPPSFRAHVIHESMEAFQTSASNDMLEFVELVFEKLVEFNRTLPAGSYYRTCACCGSITFWTFAYATAEIRDVANTIVDDGVAELEKHQEVDHLNSRLRSILEDRAKACECPIGNRHKG